MGELSRRPCPGTHFCNGHRLDAAGVGDVRTETKVDEGSASIHGRPGSVRDLVIDVVLLVLIILYLSASRSSRRTVQLTLNISSSFSLGISNLSNGCFSFTAILATSSIPFQSSWLIVFSPMCMS
jgi:hypothetical protein